MYRNYRGKKNQKTPVIQKWKKKNNKSDKKKEKQINEFKNKDNKAALIIGINYNNYDEKNKLYGCINDTKVIKELLLQKYQFNEKNICVMHDDTTNHELYPSKKNILQGMQWLVKKNKEGFTNLWFYYSGHGGALKNSVPTNKNVVGSECIIPADYKYNSYGQREIDYITEQNIQDILLKPMLHDTNLICMMDCCHGKNFGLNWQISLSPLQNNLNAWVLMLVN